MFGPLFYLLRFAGIAVYADLSLVILLLYLLYPSLMALDIGKALDTILFTVLLFASITLHEFGHSLTALRLGYQVHRIILNILGGAAFIDTTARRWSHEFLIAIAGPAVSVVLGITGYFIFPILWNTDFHGVAKQVLNVTVANFYLAVFNLMPAFPLDGGRVFRSILTPRLGFLKATEVAAWVGRAIAIFAGAYSVLWILSDAGMIDKFSPISIGMFRFEGSPILLMIAIYVYMSAEMEYRLALQEHYERGFRWTDNSQFREGDGDAWKRGPRDISEDVHVSPPPFDRHRNRYKGIRGFFRRLFRR